MRTVLRSAIATLGTLVLASGALALDTPTVEVLDQGYGKALLEITAGPSGAPYGFTVWYMTQADHDDTGWIYGPTETQGVATFTGNPTLNTWNGTLTTFILGPNESAMVEIGDLEDETGVWHNGEDELLVDTDYVFCVSANNASQTWYPGSGYSTNRWCHTKKDDCVHSKLFWMIFLGHWPVDTLSLGNVAYTKQELISILWFPFPGNGLTSLSRQLIATKLNIANGADPAAIQNVIDSADGLIGDNVPFPVGSDWIDPWTTWALTQALDDFNHGVDGDHCPPTTSTEPASWGGVKALYR